MLRLNVYSTTSKKIFMVEQGTITLPDKQRKLFPINPGSLSCMQMAVQEYIAGPA